MIHQLEVFHKKDLCQKNNKKKMLQYEQNIFKQIVFHKIIFKISKSHDFRHKLKVTLRLG